MILPSIRRKFSKTFLKSLVDQENAALPDHTPERRQSVSAALLETQSCDEDGAHNHLDTIPSRPVCPKAVNFTRPHRQQSHGTLRRVDQNASESVSVPNLEELEEIPDYEEFAKEIIPVAYVEEDDTAQFTFPPATLPTKFVPNDNVGYDPFMTLTIKNGPYYEVWDPQLNDTFSIVGKVLYSPISPSALSRETSKLIWLSVDIFLRCPRRAVGQANPTYLPLLDNNTQIELETPSPSKKQVIPKNTEAFQQRKASSHIFDLVSPQTPFDLDIKPITRHHGTQTCTFKLTLPIGNTLLFHDDGSGDVARHIKIRSRGVVKVVEKGVATVRQSVAEKDIVVNILKKSSLMDGLGPQN